MVEVVRDTDILCNCPLCRKQTTVQVNLKDYFKWKEGMLIQRAFPYLSVDERELLMTGTCPECWAKLFGGE